MSSSQPDSKRVNDSCGDHDSTRKHRRTSDTHGHRHDLLNGEAGRSNTLNPSLSKSEGVSGSHSEDDTSDEDSEDSGDSEDSEDSAGGDEDSEDSESDAYNRDSPIVDPQLQAGELGNDLNNDNQHSDNNTLNGTAPSATQPMDLDPEERANQAREHLEGKSGFLTSESIKRSLICRTADYVQRSPGINSATCNREFEAQVKTWDRDVINPFINGTNKTAFVSDDFNQAVKLKSSLSAELTPMTEEEQVTLIKDWRREVRPKRQRHNGSIPDEFSRDGLGQLLLDAPPLVDDESRDQDGDRNSSSDTDDEDEQQQEISNHMKAVAEEVSTKSSDLVSAANILGIDWRDRFFSPLSPLKLHNYQILNIAQNLARAESMLGGGIVAHGCGTGKTIEILATIYLLSQRRKKDHKAVVILCPAHLIAHWVEQFDLFFYRLLKLRIFYAASKDVRRLGPNIHQLKVFLSTLNPLNSQTSRTVILSSYTTFSRRVIHTTIIPDSDLLEVPQPRAKVRMVPKFSLEFDPGMIGTVIADEAQHIKDPRTKSCHAIRLLKADITFLITATPAMNRVSDFRGYLYALYRNEWKFNWPMHQVYNAEMEIISLPQYFPEAYADDFNPFNAVWGKRRLGNCIPEDVPDDYKEELRRGNHLWRLNPEAYRELGDHLAEDKVWSAKFGKEILRPILKLCLIRRPLTGQILLPDGTSERPADLIPPGKISSPVIKLTGSAKEHFNSKVKWYWDWLHTAGIDYAGPEGSHVGSMNEEPRSGLNTRARWRLSAFSTDPNLDSFLRPPLSYYGQISKPVAPGGVVDCEYFRKMDADLGMIWRYYMTCDNFSTPRPTTRAALVRFLCRESPALKWLLVKLWGWKEEGHKALVFVVNPLVQWEVEGVCALFNFDFLSLRCTHSPMTRSRALKAFTADNSRYDFMIATARTTGTGLDLHNNCYKTIIFELPPNVNTLLQCAGRTHRIGQTQEQEVLVPCIDRSFDDWILAMYWVKFIPKISSEDSAESGVAETLSEVKRVLACGEVLRRRLGMRYNRVGKRFGSDRYRKLSDYRGKTYRRATTLGKQCLYGPEPAMDDWLIRARINNMP